MKDQLKTFVMNILEARGAVCEERGKDEIGALFPSELSQRLGTDEYLHLSFDLYDTERDGLIITYGSEMLDKFLKLADDIGLTTFYSLSNLYLKEDERMDKEVREKFSLLNAKANPIGHDKTHCPYLILNFKYVALSDERKEDLITVAINEGSLGFCEGLENKIESSQADIQMALPISYCSPQPLEKIYEKGCLVAQDLISSELKEFEDSMNRRLQRDILRLEEYYLGLKEEMEERIKKKGLQGQDKDDLLAKIQATEIELRQKKEDLWHKYSIQINVKLINACRIFLPVVQGLYEILRSKFRREERFFWNSLLKKVEPLACESCLRDSYSFYICDHLHRVCPQCFVNCSHCGRKLCYSCMPKGSHKC